MYVEFHLNTVTRSDRKSVIAEAVQRELTNGHLLRSLQSSDIRESRFISFSYT